MKRVIIADDEHKIRQALKKLIRWEELGLTLLYECEDGDELLLQAKNLSPDIIITDMRMPGVNGEQLLKDLFALNPMIKIIVLSGFDDFSLVRQALTSRAVDYLLKPVIPQELNDSLIRAIKESSKESRSQQNIYQHNLYNYLENNLWGDGTYAVDFEEFTFGSYCLSVISIYSDNGVPDYVQTPILHQLIAEQLKNQGIVCADPKRQGILSILFFSMSAEEVLSFWNGFVSTALTTLENYYLIGIGKQYSDYYKMKDSYLEALTAIKSIEIGSFNKVILSNDTNIGPIIHDEYKKVQYLLRSFAENKNISQFQSYLTDFYKAFAQRTDVTIEQLIQCNNRILYLVEQLLISLDIFQTHHNIFNTLKFQIQQIITPETCLLEIIQFLDTLQINKTSLHGSKKEVANNVRDYLLENYCTKISLQDLADHLYLTKGYISSLFKQEFSMGVFDYVDYLRIEKAKSLLDQGHTMKDIVEQVGYYDESHLNRKFKKLVGVEPTSYRK